MRLPRYLRFLSPRCVCGYRRRCHNGDCRHAGYGPCQSFRKAAKEVRHGL